MENKPATKTTSWFLLILFTLVGSILLLAAVEGRTIIPYKRWGGIPLGKWQMVGIGVTFLALACLNLMVLLSRGKEHHS